MLPSYLLLGKLYAIKYNREECFKTYKIALERKLESPHLYFDWAVTLQLFNEYEKSKLYFLKTLACAPNEEEANSGLALVDACLDNIDEAEQVISNVKLLDDKNYLYAKATGVIAFKKGDFNTALKKFKNFSEDMFFDRSLNLYIAMCYDNLGDTTNAKEYFGVDA